MSIGTSIQINQVPAQSEHAKAAEATANEIAQALLKGQQVVQVRDLSSERAGRMALHPDGTVSYGTMVSGSFQQQPTQQTTVTGAQPWTSVEERFAAYRDGRYQTSQDFRNMVRGREAAS